MCLPASSFNRAVSFQTTSRFGRKRLHKTGEASAAHILEPPAKTSKSPRENKRNKMLSLTKITERNVKGDMPHK